MWHFTYFATNFIQFKIYTLLDLQYTSVINAWANSMEKQAGERANRLLEEQWGLYETTGNERTKPDYITYTSVMKAWVNSGHANSSDRVNDLLTDMLSRWEGGDVRLRPSRQTYDILRRAFASDDEETLSNRMGQIQERITALRQVEQ